MAQLRGTMMQSFQWYTPNDGSFWNDWAGRMDELHRKGITALWLPPAYKGMAGTWDVGYGVYDLFDCGEFDQKGTLRTKYGTKEEYRQCIDAAHDADIQVYADVVLNHRMGADAQQWIDNVVAVNPHNRNQTQGNYHGRNLWTSFTFPGRGSTYSGMHWHWWHFDATKEYGNIFKLKDKQFETHVDHENVNYDFLMGCDLDFDHEQVRGEVHYWGKWYLDTFGMDGFRIDAVKHIRSFFFRHWLDDMRNHARKNLFAVGEYWSSDISRLRRYIDETEGRMHLFDVPLHANFHHASKAGDRYDMGSILNNSLVREKPWLAVTIVENHDTQPLQSLESPVEPWFKPLAYAIILLRDEGYPCIFAADYDGAHYHDKGYDISMASHRWMIDLFLDARGRCTFGQRRDYFDHRHTIGWTFAGDAEHKSMAVVMTNSGDDTKWMETGRPHTTYRDITGHIDDSVQTNEWGWAPFRTRGGKVSVWIEE
ncbi:alpha-amylase [Prosthecochloris sp. N3]|uniref:Alpha-amylase n=1 Tax=Prosthecochloris ethylica TaxID=2743976 RepID=A0ABR9XTX1_9CHLB|nr:alpha-amylase [Prosthecochloris ethylica]MBF0587107.1 alpha-amylase [Prosthecochloris ethylica]MBF0637409.1 alpha-amylase [Prosthecochloris ethylica]NUK48049.1 alpha-amylase [Prosthecochloris ethylica]